jgi:hypothetical protein
LIYCILSMIISAIIFVAIHIICILWIFIPIEFVLLLFFVSFLTILQTRSIVNLYEPTKTNSFNLFVSVQSISVVKMILLYELMNQKLVTACVFLFVVSVFAM